jgi:hypothetical protein
MTEIKRRCTQIKVDWRWNIRFFSTIISRELFALADRQEPCAMSPAECKISGFLSQKRHVAILFYSPLQLPSIVIHVHIRSYKKRLLTSFHVWALPAIPCIPFVSFYFLISLVHQWSKATLPTEHLPSFLLSIARSKEQVLARRRVQ